MGVRIRTVLDAEKVWLLKMIHMSAFGRKCSLEGAIKKDCQELKREASRVLVTISEKKTLTWEQDDIHPVESVRKTHFS